MGLQLWRNILVIWCAFIRIGMLLQQDTLRTEYSQMSACNNRDIHVNEYCNSFCSCVSGTVNGCNVWYYCICWTFSSSSGKLRESFCHVTKKVN